jgi:hypothetical protein
MSFLGLRTGFPDERFDDWQQTRRIKCVAPYSLAPNSDAAVHANLDKRPCCPMWAIAH